MQEAMHCPTHDHGFVGLSGDSSHGALVIDCHLLERQGTLGCLIQLLLQVFSALNTESAHRRPSGTMGSMGGQEQMCGEGLGGGRGGAGGW
jgi:hypothetical protein